MRRVVVTGAGTINALGDDVTTTFSALCEGQSGIGQLAFTDVERLEVQIGAQIRNYDEKTRFSRSELSVFDRFTQYAMIAATEAISSSGIDFEKLVPGRAGAVIGTSGGGLSTQDDNFRRVYEDGKNRVPPLTVARLMQNAACSQMSMRWNLQGPVYSVSTACASSNHAMGQAFHAIRSGHTDVMLTGGTEAMLCFGGMKVWEGLRVMSPDGCRPFSRNRNGMVQGEGGAIFVFEDRDHAIARGAPILAEVCGFGASADAADLLVPNRVGAVNAMRTAIADAKCNVDDIGYINAHGTATQVNDKTECAAIRETFGHSADQLMVSSTKAMHGHIIGGTGAVELLAVILALKNSVIAPTINHDEVDPDCDLDVVPNVARDVNIDFAMSNAFAFGGLNAVLVLRKA